MKKTLYLILALLYATNNTALAQAGGLVYTVAGGTYFSTCVHGLMFDATGNLYITHYDGNTIQKVDAASGVITIVAGTGSSTGPLGDGGPATSAELDNPWSSCMDASGNMYIADEGNNRIRKVDAATNIITTIAGGGTSTADGIPATTASITPWYVVTDATGNLYIGATNKVQKVNLSTGIITTYAGTGTLGDSGDGGPATAASISSPKGMAIDAHGNLYIAFKTKVKMINAATGIITTIAGGGTLTTDGTPSTSAAIFDIRSLCLDPSGNVYISDVGNYSYVVKRILMIDAATGLIFRIAGGGTSIGDGVPALSTGVHAEALCVNKFDKSIYMASCTTSVRKFSAPTPYNVIPSAGGHFSVYPTDLCHGPDFKILTTTYTPGQGVKTYFGDGSSDTGAIVPGLGTGYHSMTHTYNSTGVYTIKHLLYNGATLIDSVSYPFNYLFCRVLPVNIYFDENANCVKDVTEPTNFVPQKVVVDSNGVVLDTLSCTAGMHYYAYGAPGDVYNFRALSSPAISVGCPSGATITDTLQTTTTHPTKYFGINCSLGSPFDLGVYTSAFGRGLRGYRGTILVDNSYCHPVPGTLTMQAGPKITSYSPSPAAASLFGGTITWNTGSLSLLATSPYKASFNGSSSIDYLPGDTLLAIINIAPTSGDVNTTNNMVIRVDTVSASFDPNMVEVTPTCIPAATNIAQLQYTVHFENMGNDTAHNIYVLDTLSGLLDASSLEMVISSAEMYISTMKDLQGRTIVKFNFPNIKLLDSSYHGLCDGMFVFKIKTKAGIAAGTQIPHRVGIYFDENPVVMTNTAYTTKGCPTLSIQSLSAADQSSVSIYPNPTTTELTIKMEDGAYSNYNITNTVGQDILTQHVAGAQTKLDISTLPAGIYFISFSGDKGTHIKKFVKM